MTPILEIKNLSKKFKIQHQMSYLSMRDRLSGIFSPSQEVEEFWALKDISFDVNPGDSIGIIGRNGAGKSTLLKILSKITPPTAGKIIGRGRIASLLEVGTGFHPELTGRENIFLNGSILGMRRHEIMKHFDAIVEFAGTENFLDTPLKHYSSGMQLRLAFSVAAFLEPEILIIDEVLAVGDAEFQKKCLGKMEEVSKSGRTILFVSHNMSAIQNLCSTAILLKQGVLTNIGPAQDVINAYHQSVGDGAQSHHGIVHIPGKSNIVKKVEVLCDGNLSSTAYMGCQLEIKVYFQSAIKFDSPVVGIVFRDSQNVPILGVNNNHYSTSILQKPEERGYISMLIPYFTLFEDIYHLDIYFGNAFKDIEVLRDCLMITVEPMKFTEAGNIPDKKFNRVFIKDIVWGFRESEIN